MNISDTEKITLNEFLEFFSICPICKNKIHKINLLDFYFKTDPVSTNLKKKLLNLMRKHKNFKGNLKVGIPCCICYSKVFPEKKMQFNFEINKKLYPYLSAQDLEEMLTFLFG